MCVCLFMSLCMCVHISEVTQFLMADEVFKEKERTKRILEGIKNREEKPSEGKDIKEISKKRCRKEKKKNKKDI